MNLSSWDGAPPSRLHLDNFVGPAPWVLFSENRSPAASSLAIASAWLQKFALFAKSFLEGPCRRLSGREVVCSK